MSKYTTELRYICEHYAGYESSGGYGNIPEIIEKARPFIFDFDYDIFDSNYKSVLETKILKHYYTDEISEETVGLWKFRLNTKMNEIMPYFNKMYSSELLEFNPMWDTDLTENYGGTKEGNKDTSGQGTKDDTQNDTYSLHDTRTIGVEETATNDTEFSETNEGNGKQDSTNTVVYTDDNSNTDIKVNAHWDYYSDTPQGGITGIAEQTYLTNARNITNNDSDTLTVKNKHDEDTTGKIESEYSDKRKNTNTLTIDRNVDSSDNLTRNTTDAKTTKEEYSNKGNEKFTNTDSYLKYLKGNSGKQSFSKLLNEYRDTLLNIDMMVIEELGILFFGLW